MKTRIAYLAAQLTMIAGAGLVSVAAQSPTIASAESLPGMCNGRTDANTVVIAHANGKPGEVPKFILNVSTDATGRPSGSLILDRGAMRLKVSDFCRLWQHIPGQPSMGECTYPEGATTAHAVGLLTDGTGARLLVRADVRELEDGQQFFRVRYRAVAGHEDEGLAAAGEEGCGDEGWTRVPAEGWYPLDQMRVAAVNGTAEQKSGATADAPANGPVAATSEEHPAAKSRPDAPGQAVAASAGGTLPASSGNDAIARCPTDSTGCHSPARGGEPAGQAAPGPDR